MDLERRRQWVTVGFAQSPSKMAEDALEQRIVGVDEIQSHKPMIGEERSRWEELL